jgi:secreted PhoX family phosphatase
LLADGLTASFLTREAANHADLFNFYPYGSANPTHMFSCIEGGSEVINAATGKLNPSVQKWDLNTGEVTTVLRGMVRCDGLRTTPWGTLVATEETTDGALYEIIDPLNVVNHQVTDRTAGTIVDGIGSITASTKIVKRQVMAEMAWEGLTVLDNGVVIGGDELRPGTAAADVDGGAIFKFVPTTPYAGGMIADLSESPLVAGKNYAMQVSCKDSGQQFGQGCEVGNAAWIEVNASTARADANANGATGYYRPEDLHQDPTFTGAGVRFCWTNTGNESSHHYGEIMCAVDADPLEAGNGVQTTVVNRFVEGNPEFTSVDSLDIHPVTGDIYGIEDHKNGDIWACLKDGADKDIKTDGCVRLLSVKDQSAEPTGFIFSPDGTKAYLSIQHSDDTGMPLSDEYRTDDIVVIEGFSFTK